MLSTDSIENDEYDNWSKVKSKVAAIGIASLWANGNPGDIVRGKQLYDIEMMRQKKYKQLKGLMKNEQSN